MLVPNKQTSLGRSHSWEPLGGNEGQWDRSADGVYEQQARVAARRSSLSYGEGGGWYEPQSGVRPPDLDLKRDPYSHQDTLYGQGYPERLLPDPRVQRKGSVPELAQYERPVMAHRGSVGHQEFYPHDPAMTPRQADGFFRGEHQPVPPPPHPLSRSASHFGMSPGARGPPSPLPPPPPPPPTAHEINRLYRDPGAAANAAAKMMPDGQRITSRAPSPAHYGLEHGSPRYASEPPAMSQPGYTDVNGHPVDPQQQPGAATCLVVDPACQGIVLRQDAGSPFTIQQQHQLQQQQLQQQQQQQLQQQQHLQQQQIQQQQLQQQQLQQQQIQQQQLQQQQLQQQQPLPPPPMSVYDPNLQMAVPLGPPPALAQVAAPVPVNIPAPPPPVAQVHSPLPPVPQTPGPVDPKKTDPEFVALLRNEGLSERTISTLIQQGFDSTGMLAVMEENDVRTVASNLGQARVLARLALNCKRPAESLPAPGQQQQPAMRGRSNSFSHRSDIYQHPHYLNQPHLSQTLAIDPHLMPPQTPGGMQTISPRMGEMMGRRPSSAPSQQLMEANGGYHGQAPRTPGAYTGAMVPVQPRPMSAYSQHSGMGMQTMMPQQMSGSMSAMSFQQLPQQMPLSMPALQQPQQVPKAYSTNYTVPMELMKRDRNLPPSPMHSPHPSPQMMRKGGPNSDCSMVAVVSGPIQGQGGSQAPMQKTSRRTGPPVIMSSMASPDLSKNHLLSFINHSN